LAIDACGSKLKRSIVLKEMNNAAIGNKTKMTTHPYKWCSAQIE
jgi:hypothetical protein